MRTIKLAESNLRVAELIELAEHDTLKLVLPDGTEFILSAIDDLGAEVGALRQNKEFINFLAQRLRSKMSESN
ncbi:hypothetical protein NIES2101_29495 [Calothrix sp. HK-06]|nr:hypothetical protein NIES2101_29495 [Calothrix sp. HK-06]